MGAAQAADSVVGAALAGALLPGIAGARIKEGPLVSESMLALLVTELW